MFMALSKTKVISAHEDGAINLAVEHLISGKLVAVPTETVYGLAADALNHVAVQHIFETKGRPANNPLICHVASITMARRYVAVSAVAEQLMQAYWPGPLTLVLPKHADSDIPETVSAGLGTLAVRCPANDAARAIINQLERPIAAPSANPSGKLSPTSAQDVLEGLGDKLPLIIDGGVTDVGIESTIVGVLENKITLLRPGTITADEISETSGLPVYDREDETISAPGQLKSHYAPDAPVRLNATSKKNDEILIGFGDISGDFSLSRVGDLHEAAHNLFSALRRADQLGHSRIAVAPIPDTGIGVAVNDRLRRAAAPRDH